MGALLGSTTQNKSGLILNKLWEGKNMELQSEWSIVDFLIAMGGLTLIGFVCAAVSYYLGELFPFIWGDWEQRDRALLKQTKRIDIYRS